MNYLEDLEPEEKSWPIIAMFLITLFCCLATFFSKEEESNGYDFSNINKRDSIINHQELLIGDLTEKIKGRDSLISILSKRESISRSAVYHELKDDFRGASDSVKEALITEALKSIEK